MQGENNGAAGEQTETVSTQTLHRFQSEALNSESFINEQFTELVILSPMSINFYRS